MMFWVLALIWRQRSTLWLAATSLSVSFAVELSQTYHAPWIDAIRSTRIGALALGSDFLWSDLACYAVGVSLAAGVDALLAGRNTTPDAVSRS
jgi:hypothetical protein